MREFVPFRSSLMRSTLLGLFVFRSSLMRSTLLELPCSLQAVFVKVALGEAVSKFVIVPNQSCAFTGLVVDHRHFVGAPGISPALDADAAPGSRDPPPVHHDDQADREGVMSALPPAHDLADILQAMDPVQCLWLAASSMMALPCVP